MQRYTDDELKTILLQNVSSHGECSDGLVARQDRHGGGGEHHGHHARRHLGSHLRTIQLICDFTTGNGQCHSQYHNHNNQVLA